jgi:LysM repeat protein
LVALALVAAAAFSGAPPADDVRRAATVQIRSAQTLWQLADEHPVPGQSIEQTVETIRELNGLEDNTLVVGTQILVPAPEPSGEQFATR